MAFRRQGQVLAYAAVESGERIAAGQSPWPGWELLAAGALAQVPSALAAWGLLALVLVPMLAALQGTVGVSAAPWLSQPAAWHLAWMAGSAAPSSLKARAPPR